MTSPWIKTDRRARLRAFWTATSCLLIFAFAACATPPAPEGQTEQNLHVIKGHWAIGDTQNVIEIRSCKDDEAKLCGHLIQFDGKQDARDYLHPNWLSWGQKLCDSLIVADLEQSEEPQIYSGSIYDPEDGQIYNLMVLVKSNDLIESRVYMGTSIDEAINLGVSALTGDVGVLSTLSFLTRAGIGKEHLGENAEWSRMTDLVDRCDTA